MAQDTTAKEAQLARDWVLASARLTDLLIDFAALRERKEQAGVDWTTPATVTAIQAEADLQHLTGDVLNAIFTNSQALATFLKSGTAGIDAGLLTGNLEDAFYQARR